MSSGFSPMTGRQPCWCVTGTPGPTTNPQHDELPSRTIGTGTVYRRTRTRTRTRTAADNTRGTATATPSQPAPGPAPVARRQPAPDVAYVAPDVVRSLREANRNSDVKVQAPRHPPDPARHPMPMLSRTARVAYTLVLAAMAASGVRLLLTHLGGTNGDAASAGIDHDDDQVDDDDNRGPEHDGPRSLCTPTERCCRQRP